MAEVDKTIEVNVPLSTAYNQWTQFEEFPRFMEGIEEVHQKSPESLHWVANVGGERKEWDARITRQVPDQVVAWESESGTLNSGTIVFKSIDSGKTEVGVHMSYEPEDLKEQAGAALGVISRRVEGDLKRFKEFIEERGTETGAWRGEIIHAKETEGSPHMTGQKAPFMDSPENIPADQVRFGETAMDASRPEDAFVDPNKIDPRRAN